MVFRLFVLKPNRLLLFHSMKSKQNSCQNEPSTGRFDGPRTRFEYGKRNAIGQTTATQCQFYLIQNHSVSFQNHKR